MTMRHIHTNLQIRIRNSELCKCCHTISVAVGKRERDSRRVSTTTGFLNVSQIAYVFPRVVAESRYSAGHDTSDSALLRDPCCAHDRWTERRRPKRCRSDR